MLFNSSLVAIDIGSSALKVLELSGRKSYQLQNYSVEPLPPGAVSDGVINDPAAIENAIKKALTTLKINPKFRRAAVSLGGSSVVIKKINIPFNRDQPADDQIHQHAEQAFQAGLDGLYYDHVVLDNRPHRDGEAEILLVGARRDLVEQYIGVVRNTGLRIGVMESSAFSVANMFESNYGLIDGLVALLAVGASHCQLSFIEKGSFLFSRDIPIGGEAYTRRFMEIGNSNYETAEAQKIGLSTGQSQMTPELQKVINEINDQIVDEFKNTVTYFSQTQPEGIETSPLGYLFMTGGGAGIPGLDAALAAATQVPVHMINPFQRIKVNEKKFPLATIMPQAPLLAIATGLGMRRKSDNKK